jgi:hypothetical protein
MCCEQVKEITFFSPFFQAHPSLYSLSFPILVCFSQTISEINPFENQKFGIETLILILNQKAEVVVCRESVPSPNWNLPPIFSVRPDFSLLVCKWYSTELYRVNHAHFYIVIDLMTP